MGNNEAYWLPICELATRLRCWERLSANDGRARWITDWHMLLSIPTPGYLEVGEGPVPIRQVEWVELSTLRVRGGIAGRPRQVVDIADDVASNLRQTATIWEFQERTTPCGSRGEPLLAGAGASKNLTLMPRAALSCRKREEAKR
jgi:hypothetical protein